MTMASPWPTASHIDPWQTHSTRIAAIADETEGVRSYRLRFDDAAVGDAFRFAAGQFNMLYVPGVGEAAISISSDPEDVGTLTHTVRAVGNVTDALARLTVGDQVFVRGPFGTPWPVDRVTDRDVVFVAGGLGLASQRSAILRAALPGTCRHATVLHGAKRPGELLYTGEYDAWRRAGVTVATIVDEGGPAWNGRCGLVTALLDDAIDDPARTTVLCCGPDPMMVGVAEKAIDMGVSIDAIFLSLERTMACAAAHCGLCQFGPLFVCRDGPVLRYDRIGSLMKVPRL